MPTNMAVVTCGVCGKETVIRLGVASSIACPHCHVVIQLTPPDVSQEAFDDKLREILGDLTVSALLLIPGIYEIVSEEFNNEILTRLGEDQEEPSKCCPECRGWAHFNVGEDSECIERCDECGIFDSDEEAAVAHARHCHCGADDSNPCIRCHGCGVLFNGKIGIDIDDRIYCSSTCAKKKGSTN